MPRHYHNGTNQLHALICTHCGEPLFRDGDQYVCKTCGCHFEADHQEELDARIRALFSEEKMEKLANARRLLYQATHAKNPSQDAVISSARLLLSLHQDEPLAEIYLHSHDEDPYELVRVLSHASLDSFQAKEAYSWLLPSLSLRTIGPLKDFVSRHFSNEERTVRLNQIEEEAAKLEDGLYEANLPRDVFLAYSSSDMAKVIETMDLLEENGLVVFAAFRNVRHGKGAQENYLSTIKEAMEACKCFMFLSSTASRQMSCDAMREDSPKSLGANAPNHSE